MNILNAVKTIFSTERQASYASSTNGVPTVVIDGTNNGQGDGCMKFSTLASVLGGLQVIESTTLANGFNTDIRYSFISMTTGAPEGWPFSYDVGGGYLVQFFFGETLLFQLAVQSGGAQVAIRTKWFGSNFNNWRYFTTT